mmetsp:Transcript_28923/g.60755  ORF Transcript_28923/g.60755 Transcript_28923/m.60755 type:complete len:278 (+) Transcript_28923:699-1532(+)
MGDMERILKWEILKGDPLCSCDSVRIKAEPISETQFATRGDQILDSACRLAVHYTHAPGDDPRQTNGAKRRRRPAASEAATHPPPDASPSQPLASASFAAVVADLPLAAFSVLAAAASEQHAELKASFKPPLDHGRVLAAAKAALVLLEGVMGTWSASPVSQTTRLRGLGLLRRMLGFGWQCKRPCSLCIAQRRYLPLLPVNEARPGLGASPPSLRPGLGAATLLESQLDRLQTWRRQRRPGRMARHRGAAQIPRRPELVVQGASARSCCPHRPRHP